MTDSYLFICLSPKAERKMKMKVICQSVVTSICHPLIFLSSLQLYIRWFYCYIFLLPAESFVVAEQTKVMKSRRRI